MAREALCDQPLAAHRAVCPFSLLTQPQSNRPLLTFCLEYSSCRCAVCSAHSFSLFRKGFLVRSHLSWAPKNKPWNMPPWMAQGDGPHPFGITSSAAGLAASSGTKSWLVDARLKDDQREWRHSSWRSLPMWTISAMAPHACHSRCNFPFRSTSGLESQPGHRCCSHHCLCRWVTETQGGGGTCPRLSWSQFKCTSSSLGL